MKGTLREETLREGGDVVGGGWRRPVTRWRCGRLVAVERLVAGAATEGATSAGRSATEISFHITYYHINVLQIIISTPLQVLVGIITFDATLISMHEALKGLSNVTAAHCISLCQGEGHLQGHSLIYNPVLFESRNYSVT